MAENTVTAGEEGGGERMGASASQTELPGKAEAPTDLRPAGGYLSRKAAEAFEKLAHAEPLRLTCTDKYVDVARACADASRAAGKEADAQWYELFADRMETLRVALDGVTRYGMPEAPDFAAAIPSEEDIFGDFDAADYKPDLASAIAAEIMCLKWTHALPASDDVQDEIVASGEHCNRYGDVQETVAVVLERSRVEPHTTRLAAANPSGGWRPIETAPDEGEFLVGLHVWRHDPETREIIDRYEEQHVVAIDEETGEIAADCDRGWRLRDYEFWKPLDPLPPAPCDGSAEGGETGTGSTEGNSAVDEVQAPDPILPGGEAGLREALIIEALQDVGAHGAVKLIAQLQSDRARLEAENERLRHFATFALKWCDRGPPHGGPGNEVQAFGFIRHHPVLSAMRRAALAQPQPEESA